MRFSGTSCNFANRVFGAYHRDNFSDAPQVVLDDYPEYVSTTQKLISTSSEGLKPEANPRRRLGDMNARTFWLLIALVVVVIIAASVGGAVGGVAAVRKSHTKDAISRYFGSRCLA